MSDTVWTNMRPAGEWLVEMYRPPTRFGWVLKVGVRGLDGEFWVARANQGSWEYTRHSEYTEAPDAVFLDDELLLKIRDLVNGQHPEPPGHAEDVVAVRDKLLSMLNEQLARYHDITQQALGRGQ